MSESELYTNYFKQEQTGGSLVVVRHRNQTGSGLRYERNQVGEGFLDWLKGVGKALFPSLVSGAANFATGLVNAKSQGMSFKDAAKSAISPVATNLMKDAAEIIKNETTKAAAERAEEQKPTAQAGSGYKRRRSKAKRNKNSKKFKFSYYPPPPYGHNF